MVVALLAAVPRLCCTPGQGSETRTVSIYLTVEQGNKLIQGLTQQNFRVIEDGEHRDSRLEPPEKPITIALVVEYSQASYIYFGDIQAAIDGFLKVAPEGNWYALVTYSHGWDVLVDFTKVLGRIPVSLNELGQFLLRLTAASQRKREGG